MKARFLKRLEALERAWPEKIPVVPMMMVTRFNAGLPDEWVVVDGLHMTPAEADTHIKRASGHSRLRVANSSQRVTGRKPQPKSESEHKGFCDADEEHKRFKLRA